MTGNASTTAPATREPLASTTKWLWKAVGIACLLVLTFVVMNTVVLRGEKQLRAGDLGHDFLAFYTAGTFARQGEFTRMYDMHAVRDFEFGVAEQIGLKLGPGFMPWWNPPFAAIPFEALSRLPYRDALGVWLGINLLAVALAVVMLTSIVRRAAGNIDWRTWALVPALVVTSVPFALSLTHGQNTGVSLLVVTAVAMLWRAKKAFLAGLVCGLMFYKPQLGALVAVALVIRFGWRAIAGVMCTGTVLLAVTLWHMPGALEAFLFQMPANLVGFQENNPYYWERHVTFKAFWRLLLQGHGTGVTTPLAVVLWTMSTVALAGGLVWLLVKRSTTEDKAIAATIVCSPLIMPFYFDYDLLLMAVPVALYTAERLARSRRFRYDGWLTLGWCATAVYMIPQPHVAEATNFNGTALLLTFCGALMLMWAHQTDAQEAVNPQVTFGEKPRSFDIAA